jgi:hypothetical protein
MQKTSIVLLLSVFFYCNEITMKRSIALTSMFFEE